MIQQDDSWPQENTKQSDHHGNIDSYSLLVDQKNRTGSSVNICRNRIQKVDHRQHPYPSKALTRRLEQRAENENLDS